VQKFYQELRDEHDEVCENFADLEALLAEHVTQDEKALTDMSAPGKGRPKSLAFEHQVRTILASGCSARAALEQVLSSARVYLPPATFDAYELLVPNLRWYVSCCPISSSPTLTSLPHTSPRFQQQREALGNEAWLYAMIELARADKVLQWGFDETSIDGTPTLNQWVLIPNGELVPRIVTVQCSGVYSLLALPSPFHPSNNRACIPPNEEYL
jgi:hypothetical protein